MTEENKERIILGVTGASGMLYVPELLSLLTRQAIDVHAIVSDTGRQVLFHELGLAPEALPGVTRWFSCEDFTAPMASGSSLYRGMLVLPCTMGTLGAVASGVCRNLIHRAADVTLKERRPLVLAVRETPFNRTHLRNMLLVQEAGAILCPLMPSFYQKPDSLQQMARHLAGRLCDQLGLPPAGLVRWQGEA